MNNNNESMMNDKEIKTEVVETKTPHGGAVDREQVLERRKKQLELRYQGRKTKHIHDVLSAEYGVERGTIEADWSCRDKWILDAISLSNMVETVGSSITEFASAQATRREILGDIVSSIDAFRVDHENDGHMSVKATEQLQSLYSTVLRLLNDVESSTEKKIAMLTKLGILKKAAQHLVVEHKGDDKPEKAINWIEVVGDMSDDSRREFFDSLSAHKEAVIDV